jgi:PTS system cellobiose-specific IIC component
LLSGIRLPDQVPPMIKNSFDLLIPVLVVVLTLYPLSLFIQSQFDMLIPQAIMAIFKPLVSAADSLPAILLAVLIGHLLWFAGIHGAAIVSGMLQMFWLTNLGMNQTALAQSAPLPHIFMEAFWTFFIVIGGSGATMGLVFCYLRSRSAHLRSIGRLSVVPSIFNINEPVIFGTPIVMNPVFFIPFLLAPMVNAVLAWAAMKLDLIGRVISVVPWTAPAPVGAAWALGWDFRAAVLVVLLALVSAIIYYPFFKVYEKQLLAQEAEEAQRADEESQQVA